MQGSGRSLLFASLILLGAADAQAESIRSRRDSGDHYDLSLQSDTHAELFRRALLPGPNGSLVSTDTALPLYEYASLRVRDLDTPFRKDSLDLELAVWGRSWFDAQSAEKLFDGDVQVANARLREGPLSLRLGRQQLAGGAARFVRFDGAALEAALGSGLDLSAYGGWTVLSRWDRQLRYAHLGGAPDSVLRADSAFGPGQRRDYWLSGGRIGFAAGEQRFGMSFHEQHERGGLARRNWGIDGRTRVLPNASLGLNTVLDLDRGRFADARLWLDAALDPRLDLSFEYLHSEPALFLSSQSVLSVFGSESYDEVGSYTKLRVSDALSLDGSAFVDVYSGERPGARGELAARCWSDASRRTFLRVAYARLLGPENGYHSLRSSIASRLGQRLRATIEAYAYLYDHAIRRYRASTVYAGTVSYDALPGLTLLWGASLARTPYADLDAQTELRLSYAFDRVEVKP